MNTIIIQNTLEKFIQSSLDLNFQDTTTIIDIVINNNLFAAFYKHKPKYCIFSYSQINEEIIQFCNDHVNDSKIFIYYNENIAEPAHVIPGCITMGHNTNYHIQIPKNMVNQRIINENRNIDRTNQNTIVYYAEYRDVPAEVLALLYPNTNLPIKIFDAPTLHHYQNLGLLSEAERISLLYDNKYYLFTSTNNSYLSESILAGCVPIFPNDILDNSYSIKELPKLTNYTTYSEFFKNKVLV